MNRISRRHLLMVGSAAAVTMLPNHSAAHPATGDTSHKPRLAVCYYPEQWPESWWSLDARDMVQRGISRVRIGEFAWTLMEPEPNTFNWGWLDRAIDTLAKAGLEVILGTPTATPPKWLVDAYPEILPVGADGRTRGFGSRRYYTFSSLRYRAECVRIATALAERYGNHPGVAGWQIDNEFGCHDTTLSYGPVDLAAFRKWLAARYQTVDQLNAAWGTIAWSQQVSAFDDVELPISTPYDVSPSILLDYRRFATDQIRDFQRAQLEVIRPRSPGRFITTNFMGNFVDFDHYAIGDDLDFASWDAYPLGFAARSPDTRWDRTGNPDFTGWNHDMMRAINPAPFWVMEQQAGPVNWSKSNPIPDMGMVRLWTWEAFAYGASTVSYFRWRQTRIGAEQMHSGLNAPDRSITPGGKEAEQVGREIQRVGPLPRSERGDVALVFDYESAWMNAIQPGGTGTYQTHLTHVQSWYAALRRMGLDVDIVRPGTSLAGYKLVVLPSVWNATDALCGELKRTSGLVVFGPRSGSKTSNFAIPDTLPPGPLQGFVEVKVEEVEMLREGTGPSISGSAIAGTVVDWREELLTELPVLATYSDGHPAVVGSRKYWYVGCRGDTAFTRSMLQAAARTAELPVTELPDGIRLKRRGGLHFAFNYTDEPWEIPAKPKTFILGQAEIGPHDLAIWREG